MGKLIFKKAKNAHMLLLKQAARHLITHKDLFGSAKRNKNTHKMHRMAILIFVISVP